MLPWPEFWSHIPPSDRQPLRECIADLLKTGAILGDEGSGRELFLVARDQYFRELSDWFAILNIELVVDSERALMQARPIPGECELVATFSKEETLLVLTLWRIWDEAMSEKPAAGVVVTANDVWLKLKLFFDRIEPPTETSIERMLAKLRRKRLIRYQRHEDNNRFGESLIEVLPTLPRAIPFQDLEAWEAQAATYQPEEQQP